MKCSYPKSAHMLCMLRASKHSSKPAYTLQAVYMHPVYMHPPTQACAYSARCVHASLHSSLRIFCKLCTCIHTFKPPHTLQAVYMHPHTQASAYSASFCKMLCTFRPRMHAFMQVCMRALHAKFTCRPTGREMHAHAEHACRLACRSKHSICGLGCELACQ